MPVRLLLRMMRGLRVVGWLRGNRLSGSVLLVDRVSQLTVFKLCLVVEQELVVLVYLLFYLSEHPHRSRDSMSSSVSVFHLVLRDFVLLKGVDKLLADSHYVCGEVGPFDLGLVERLLCEMLLLLQDDHSLLHLKHPLTHFIVRADTLTLTAQENVENQRVLLTKVIQAKLKCAFMDEAL